MTAFFVVLLTTAVFAFVASPLRKQGRVPGDGRQDEDDRLAELESRKHTTYAMLKELEFDHESGLLTDEDYGDLRERYEGRAINILKSIDAAESGADDVDAIEKEVRRLRLGTGQAADGPSPGVPEEVEQELPRYGKEAQPPGPGHPDGSPEDEVERQVRELRRGRQHAKGHEIRRQPGGKTPSAGRRNRFCTRCGTERQAGDRFCADCGASLGNRGA